MERKYLAFDIEIAKILPDDVDDLKAHRPLGICCAATLAEDEESPYLWYSKSSDGSYQPRMTRDDLEQLVDALNQRVANGYSILTWNGLGFDFDILAEESGRLEDCRQLAIDHVDMMFQVFCEKGFPVSLNAASQAIGSPGKLEGIDGEMAPRLWAGGSYDSVLDYVSNDCQITLDVAIASEKRRAFSWITRKGTRSGFGLFDGQWSTAREAMKFPEPDTSWMSNPMSRSRFTSWLE